MSDMAIFRQLPSRMILSENKPVKRITMLALVVGSLCGSALCQYAAEFSSYHSGNRYDFRLTREQLSNTPAWLEDEPNPPLSPGAAKNAALLNALKEELFALESEKIAGTLAPSEYAEQKAALEIVLKRALQRSV